MNFVVNVKVVLEPFVAKLLLSVVMKQVKIPDDGF